MKMKEENSDNENEMNNLSGRLSLYTLSPLDACVFLSILKTSKQGLVDLGTLQAVLGWVGSGRQGLSFLLVVVDSYSSLL